MTLQPAVSRGGRKAELGVALACLALFLAACAAPALEFRNVNTSALTMWRGIEILLLGWLGAFVGQFAWFANLLFGLGLVLLILRRRTGALLSSTAAVVVAADTYVLFSQQVPADEGGVSKLILQNLRAGFYVWAAALVLLLLGALVLRQRT